MYDSRTDRADFSGPLYRTDSPYHFMTSTGWRDPRVLHKFLKRKRSKRLRRDWDLPANGKTHTYFSHCD